MICERIILRSFLIHLLIIYKKYFLNIFLTVVYLPHPSYTCTYIYIYYTEYCMLYIHIYVHILYRQELLCINVLNVDCNNTLINYFRINYLNKIMQCIRIYCDIVHSTTTVQQLCMILGHNTVHANIHTVHAKCLRRNDL